MLSLTPTQRRFLRTHAHALHPVVMIGNAGLSEAVWKELESSLKSHELIKVKVASDDKTIREGVLNEICAKLIAAPVQHIGKILVIYKAAEKPKLTLPKN